MKAITLFAILALLLATPGEAKIQKQGIKTAAECVTDGATAATCLPEDTQIYVTANGLNKQLSAAITAGDFGDGNGGPTFTTITSDTTMVAGNRYMTNKSSTPAVMTLPSSCSVGDELSIVGLNTAGWQVYSNASASAQQIAYGSNASTTSSSSAVLLASGVTGKSCMHFFCGISNQLWLVADAVEITMGLITSATGGSVATDGDYKVHTFTSSGSFVVSTGTGYVASLVVAGGGGGGSGTGSQGGGGAGGMIYTTPGAVYGPGTYTVTVGAGGSAGASGNNSVFDTVTATAGGFGDGSSCGTGGSGGGKGNGTGCAGTGGQGFAGGNGTSGSTEAGGGGGAGAVGANGAAVGGNGGVGVANSITGSSVFYAGGGGGGGGTGGSGGNGGGGAGGSGGNGTAGTANKGGGGGGAANGSTGGAGGAGVVIVRYKFQ